MARFFLIQEALREERLMRRRHRLRLREELDIMRLPDLEFVKTYRLNKTVFEELCKDLVPRLPPKSNRQGVDPVHKILAALSFYARGSYQGQVGQNQDAPMAQQTVSRCIHEVTMALNSPSVVAKYIRFPEGKQDRTLIKTKFYNKYGLPGICGCIDSTHLAIIRPAENEDQFLNTKQYYSINMQVICDSDNIILNVDASYGGATHDSLIWERSEVKNYLEPLSMEGETSFLLGDSTYPLREYLVTPFVGALDGTPQGAFNELHERARSTIDRTFGILKGRFRCLLAAKELHYSPEKAGRIAIACCLLNNMCVRADIEGPELTEDERAEEMLRQPFPLPPPTSSAEVLQRGTSFRDQLVTLINSEKETAEIEHVKMKQEISVK